MHHLSFILGHVGAFAVDIISAGGYLGVAFLMALESMIVPLPSELVMPFAGFAAAQGKLNFPFVVLASAAGSLIGSLISYTMGYFGGNRFVVHFGKYLFLDVADLKKTEDWFDRQGEKTIFISRFVPVVRHFISIPAGIGRMNLGKFCLYTVLGAAPWNAFLTYLGFVLGENWREVRHYSEYLSIAVALLLTAGTVYFFVHHIRDKQKSARLEKELAG